MVKQQRYEKNSKILLRHIFKGLFGGLYIMWLGMAIVVLGISMVIGKIIMYLEKKVEELK